MKTMIFFLALAFTACGGSLPGNQEPNEGNPGAPCHWLSDCQRPTSDPMIPSYSWCENSICCQRYSTFDGCSLSAYGYYRIGTRCAPGGWTYSECMSPAVVTDGGSKD